MPSMKICQHKLITLDGPAAGGIMDSFVATLGTRSGDWAELRVEGKRSGEG